MSDIENPSGSTGGSSGSRVKGLTGENNAISPNTKYDFAAVEVTLRNPSDGSVVVRINTGTITCDIGLAGPAVNGRDQAGAFAANSWIHFYFIWNGTTLATIASLTAPPTGPTLPTGYQWLAYATAIRYNSVPVLLGTKIRGSVVSYNSLGSILSAGTATVETAVSCSAFVPPNALSIFLSCRAKIADAASNGFLLLRHTSGSTFIPSIALQTPVRIIARIPVSFAYQTTYSKFSIYGALPLRSVMRH